MQLASHGSLMFLAWCRLWNRLLGHASAGLRDDQLHVEELVCRLTAGAQRCDSRACPLIPESSACRFSLVSGGGVVPSPMVS